MQCNPLRNEVVIMLDGIAYVMRPSFEALVLIEKQLSQTLIQIADKISTENISLTELAVIIEICMEKRASAEFIQDAIVRGGMTSALNAVADLMMAIFSGIDTQNG